MGGGGSCGACGAPGASPGRGCPEGGGPGSRPPLPPSTQTRTHTHTGGEGRGKGGGRCGPAPGPRVWPRRLWQAAGAGCSGPATSPSRCGEGSWVAAAAICGAFLLPFSFLYLFYSPPPPFFFPVFFFLNFPFADCKWMPCGSVLGRRCPFAYELGSGAAAGRAASLNAANHASRMGFLLLFFLLPLICPKGGISRVSLFWGYTTSG